MARLSFPQTSFELLQYVKSFEFSNFRSDSSKGKQDLKLVRNRMFPTHCVSSNYFECSKGYGKRTCHVTL